MGGYVAGAGASTAATDAPAAESDARDVSALGAPGAVGDEGDPLADSGALRVGGGGGATIPMGVSST